MKSGWIAFALGLDLLFGDPRAHPVVAIGWVITRLEHGLVYLCGRTRLAGVLLVFLTLGVTLGLASSALLIAQSISPVLEHLLAVMLAWLLVALRSLHGHSRSVILALEAGDLPRARQALRRIVGRDTAHLDENEIMRATVETVAENTSDGIVAPLFYLWLLGPLGMVAYKTINTLDSMVGYRNPKYRYLGWAAARLDDVANFLPARLTAFLFIAAVAGSANPNHSARRAMHVLWRDRNAHPSPNAGWPEAAIAGALGICLGGNNSYAGVRCEKPKLGDSVWPMDRSCYRSTILLMYAATALFVLMAFFLDVVVR